MNEQLAPDQSDWDRRRLAADEPSVFWWRLLGGKTQHDCVCKCWVLCTVAVAPGVASRATAATQLHIEFFGGQRAELKVNTPRVVHKTKAPSIDYCAEGREGRIMFELCYESTE